jgi:hypothetical protein
VSAAPSDLRPEPEPTGDRAATTGAATATALSSGHQRGGRPRDPIAVTALFDSADAVDRALDALYTAGTPRDLIEVVVSRDAAQRFYADQQGQKRRGPRALGRETWRYAGAGSLLGFIGGVLLSLVMVAWPGIDAPGGLALVQLAGPNLGTVAGAAIGALVGATRRRRPDRRHARAAEAANAIVLAVNARNAREAEVLAQLLGGQGGREVRVDAP